MPFPIIDLRHNLEGYLTKSFFEMLNPDSTNVVSRILGNEGEISDASINYSNILYKITKLTGLLNTQKDFDYLCSYSLEKLKTKNPLYTELSYSPQLYMIKDFNVRDQINVLIDTIKRSNLNIKININFIRELGIDSASNIYIQLKDIFDDEILFWLKGISLGGNEGTSNVQVFTELFRNAHEDNLLTTAIAGLITTSSQNIWESIFSIQIDRITYGHHIMGDNNLFRHFRVVQTPIEISSTFLNKFLLNNEKTAHLYYEFYNSGLNVVFISDFHELILKNSDPLDLLKNIGFSDDTLDDIIVFNPIRATFLSNFEKGELMDKALNYLHS
ncbi:MAG: hypothetical protein ACW967_01805 [Candidatus Hodarchaeales archaeon]|jgi:adenosine deaminase